MFCQCCSINKLTLVVKPVFFRVTEIVIVQCTLKHIWKNDDFLYKQPPILQSEAWYAEWKQVIEIWSLFMDLLKEKQGSIVFLSLPQKIHECVWHLAIMDISWTDALWVIVDKLDKIYLCDEHTMAYMAFHFNSYRRTAGVNINDFWYSKKNFIKNYINLELPCQKEFRPFLFWIQWMYQKKTKS